MRRIGWCASFVLLAVLACTAQVIRVPESWQQLAAKADEVVNVTLDQKMLQFGSSFMNDEKDAEVKQMMSKLKGIYVHSLEFKQPGAFSDADVAPIRAQLQGPEWSQIVDVNNKADQEKVGIYIKRIGGRSMGLVILAQEPKELTFVHFDGPIDPEDMKKLGGNFGIPPNLPLPADKNGAPSQSKPAAPAIEH